MTSPFPDFFGRYFPNVCLADITKYLTRYDKREHWSICDWIVGVDRNWIFAIFRMLDKYEVQETAEKVGLYWYGERVSPYNARQINSMNLSSHQRCQTRTLRGFLVLISKIKVCPWNPFFIWKNLWEWLPLAHFFLLWKEKQFLRDQKYTRWNTYGTCSNITFLIECRWYN